MPQSTYFIGIDNGGTMSKAAVFDAAGREVAMASRRVNTISPRPGWSERDMGALWMDTAEAIREAVAKSGLAPGQIKGLACTGHGNGLYLLDKAGRPLRHAINSSDSRAQSYVERWLKEGIWEKVLPRTAQSLWAAQPAPLLAWLRDNEPGVFRNTGTVFMAKDYIRHCLTGERLAEITDMSGTGLMSVVERRYDKAVLDAHALPEVAAWLAPLVESADLAGSLSREAAGLTGLLPGTPVAGGMFDIDACALSSGILDSSLFSIVAGTWGNNQYIARQPLIDRELFMTSCYSIPGWFLMLEGSPTSAGNLEWFIDTFLAGERRAAAGSGAFYADISAQVARIKPADSQLLFLPFLYGCNCGSLRGGFHGLDSSHGTGALLRAVFEGVAFAHFQHIERLLKFRDFPSVIRFTGGAAKDPVWCQIFADVIGVPVEVPSGSELGALGAAMAASVATGHHTGFQDAVKAMASVDKIYEPAAEQTAIYRAKYAAYQALIQKLKAS
ncbi:MAG: carbohydrate kinase [Puniceicoccales bacterium]|jgi:L-xylulokinase|nr:carbohydrate kinase [Puniceicoccales bacterium]